MQAVDYIKIFTKSTSQYIETLVILNNALFMFFRLKKKFHPYSMLTMHLHRRQS